MSLPRSSPRFKPRTVILGVFLFLLTYLFYNVFISPDPQLKILVGSRLSRGPRKFASNSHTSGQATETLSVGAAALEQHNSTPTATATLISEISTSQNETFPLHPMSINQLWTKVTPKLIVRRQGYFDIRDVNHVSIAFISMHDDRERQKPQIYAQIFYSSYSLCTELEYWAHSGELDIRKEVEEYYVHYLLRNVITNISATDVPLMAKLTIDKACSRHLSASIKIKDTREQKQDWEYGVCLHKGLYDLNEPQLLLDWVELNLALGAKIITVYLQNVPESYYTIMLPYIKKGVVEVVDWNMKPPLVPGYTKHWGQTATITECIFRNIYRVKYLGLMDIDEFFVPQKDKTIPDMFRELEKSQEIQKAASYILYNAFMYDDRTPLPELKNAKKCSSMKWPRYYRSTLRSSNPKYQYGYHKIIVKPLAVNSAWYHYIFSWQNGYNKQYFVPVEVGLTHHYRVPEKNKRDRKARTFIMSRYFEQTKRGISDQMCS